MALRELLLPWDGQPQEAVGIDPRWRGITDVFVGSSLRTVVLGSAVDVVGASFAPSSAGIAASMQTGTSNRLLISTDQKKIVPDGQSATIGVLRRCRDTTARASSLFGYVNGSTDRALAHAPYSDGNLYWDFGNTTTSSGGGRISVAFTKSTEWEVLVFVAGPKKGREVWRNATKIASNTSLTATKTSASSSFAVGNAFNGAVSADNEDIALFFASSAEWSDAEIVSWVSNPWQLFAPQSVGVPVSAGAGGTTISATTGDAAADGATAAIYQGTVVSAGTGNATADGSAASVSTTVTISAGVGAAAADGSTASVYSGAGIAASVGNAVADGTTAAVYQGAVISASVGNAAADGATASITNTSGTTISATAGNAVADGAMATLQLGIVISGTTGNAVADGSAASITSGVPLARYFDVLSGKLMILKAL